LNNKRKTKKSRQNATTIEGTSKLTDKMRINIAAVDQMLVANKAIR
jgi:3-methyladenine DNA glycosylase Mpg